MKIGILGGTFNPVHKGHMELVSDAAAVAGLDKVLLIPAKLSPFKLDDAILPAEVRLEMVRLAVEEYSRSGALGQTELEASDIEMKLEGVSYTYLTLRKIREIYGRDAKLYFITGTDAFLGIEKWYHAEELLENYSFAIGDNRPGYEDSGVVGFAREITAKYGTEIVIVPNRPFDVSSHEIREIVASGGEISAFVPAAVAEYIKENGLYLQTT